MDSRSPTCHSSLRSFEAPLSNADTITLISFVSDYLGEWKDPSLLFLSVRTNTTMTVSNTKPHYNEKFDEAFENASSVPFVQLVERESLRESRHTLGAMSSVCSEFSNEPENHGKSGWRIGLSAILLRGLQMS